MDIFWLTLYQISMVAFGFSSWFVIRALIAVNIQAKRIRQINNAWNSLSVTMKSYIESTYFDVNLKSFAEIVHNVKIWKFKHAYPFEPIFEFKEGVGPENFRKPMDASTMAAKFGKKFETEGPSWETVKDVFSEKDDGTPYTDLNVDRILGKPSIDKPYGL